MLCVTEYTHSTVMHKIMRNAVTAGLHGGCGLDCGSYCSQHAQGAT